MRQALHDGLMRAGGSYFSKARADMAVHPKGGVCIGKPVPLLGVAADSDRFQ